MIRVVVDGSPLIGPKSGVASYTASLIRALSTLDDIQLRVFFDSLRIIPQAILRAHCLPELPAAHFPLPKRLLQKLWRWGLLSPSTVSGPTEIVHSTNFAVYPMRDCRQVVMLHDVSVQQHPEWHFRERVREMREHLTRIREADAVLVSTDYVKMAASMELGIATSRVHKVPLGVAGTFHETGVTRQHAASNPTQQDPVTRVRSQYGLPPNYLLFVGTIEPRKNLVALMAAFASLPAEVRREYPLTLAGHPGWRTRPIYEAAAPLVAEGTVRFLGGVPDDDLPGLYAGATVFVYPSLEEGFGLPPIEAMACGTPVIVSDAPALAEVSGPGACVVPRNDIDALAAAIAHLLADSGERARLAESGRRHAAQFTWDRTARETLAVYRHVLGLE